MATVKGAKLEAPQVALLISETRRTRSALLFLYVR